MKLISAAKKEVPPSPTNITCLSGSQHSWTARADAGDPATQAWRKLALPSESGPWTRSDATAPSPKATRQAGEDTIRTASRRGAEYSAGSSSLPSTHHTSSPGRSLTRRSGRPGRARPRGGPGVLLETHSSSSSGPVCALCARDATTQRGPDSPSGWRQPLG